MNRQDFRTKIGNAIGFDHKSLQTLVEKCCREGPDALKEIFGQRLIDAECQGNHQLARKIMHEIHGYETFESERYFKRWHSLFRLGFGEQLAINVDLEELPLVKYSRIIELMPQLPAKWQQELAKKAMEEAERQFEEMRQFNQRMRERYGRRLQVDRRVERKSGPVSGSYFPAPRIKIIRKTFPVATGCGRHVKEEDMKSEQE